MPRSCPEGGGAGRSWNCGLAHYCQGWIRDIIYWRPRICSYVIKWFYFSTGSSVIPILVQIKLIGPLYVHNTRYFPETETDISSDLHVFEFQCIFRSKSKVLFDEIFVEWKLSFSFSFNKLETGNYSSSFSLTYLI